MQVEQLVVGMMGVCCYIVSCGQTREAAVIDPGGDEDRILDRLQKKDLILKYIINTHGHLDHVCGNGPVQQATGAKIVMQEDDIAYFAEPAIRRYFSGLGLAESPPADISVREGDTITIGQEQLQVFHTPGHTPGSICLYSAPHCFTGDTLFVGAVGRTDFPKGSMRQLVDSIRTKLLVLPPDTVVWPGHGYGGLQSTVGQEAQNNPYL